MFPNRMNLEFQLKVHTFGEPRVGDIQFAGYFTDMVPYAFRIVHNTDPIPHLPPLNVENESGPGNPYHHPREIWYVKKYLFVRKIMWFSRYNDDFSSYVMCSEVIGEDWSCSDKKKFWNYGHKVSCGFWKKTDENEPRFQNIIFKVFTRGLGWHWNLSKSRVPIVYIQKQWFF